MPAAKRPRKPAAAKVDLQKLGARVISVGGPFNCRTLIELRTEQAQEMFPDGALGAAAPSLVVEAVEHDLATLREHAPELADSALAASAVAMALEIEDPYNSATSKANCQARLADALKELRELAPPAERKDAVDEIGLKRDARRADAARIAAAKTLPRT